MTDHTNLLVLSFGVICWDRLGWKETFASRENTQRHYDDTYGILERRFVATPPVVINGHIDTVGNERAELMRAVDEPELRANAPSVTLSGTNLTVADAPVPAGRADVCLVCRGPCTVHVPTQAGESGCRLLPHRNVVHQFVSISGSNGKAATYHLPAATNPAHRTAILVQVVLGGPTIASFKN